MKKMTLLLAAATLALSAPLMAMEHDMQMDHGSMKMDHGAMKMEHGSMEHMGKTIHEGVVDGVKATFTLMDIKAQMEKMGMKETNHLMVMFTDAKTGKPMAGGEAMLKLIAPDKTEQVKNMMGMGNGFGSDVIMAKPGKYGIMCKFKLADGKVHQAKFWYTVK